MIQGRHSCFAAMVLFCCSCAFAKLAYSQQPELVLGQLQGRALLQDEHWLVTWPGVSLTSRFSGSKVGVVLDDSVNYYQVIIDGERQKPIQPALGKRTIWFELTAGEHSITLVKRSESPDYAGRLYGFMVEQSLPTTPATKMIEFIGDSWSAALANESTQRECSPEQIRATSDASRSFAALVASHYQAAWQLNAMSGMGMVRNWGGNLPHTDFRQYYPRLLQTQAKANAGAEQSTNPWQPQVIVIALGTNDFSQPVAQGEKWTQEQLAEHYRQAYLEFITQQQAKYSDAHIIIAANYLWPDDRFRPLAQALVTQLQQQGNKRIHYLDWGELGLNGCQWHPDLNDHQKMANRVIALVDQIQPWAN
ncbi:SGNH/GDSL hydrolase family protein [Motilimonas eburnea]|uniref:SGNH/GDSL hydrolase family protein n=1 Tax=Motilimonas eburnea TaxID=1737488 RepID=UPI001E56C2A0|nr:SGNH/GDSL hydrolase family protein [Motilimonas eburnea]MCE2572861.1 hypothetical protein [Motilimonas eburnea]